MPGTHKAVVATAEAAPNFDVQMKRIEQIEDSEWQEIGDPEYIATLPIYPEDLEKKLGLQFTKFEDDGLGICKTIGLKIEDTIFALSSHPEGPEIAHYLCAKVRSFEKDSKKALLLLLDALDLKRSELLWEQEDLGPARWILFRIDDNGNEIEMNRFLNERSAEWVRRKYKKNGHKQFYFVTRENI